MLTSFIKLTTILFIYISVTKIWLLNTSSINNLKLTTYTSKCKKKKSCCHLQIIIVTFIKIKVKLSTLNQVKLSPLLSKTVTFIS